MMPPPVTRFALPATTATCGDPAGLPASSTGVLQPDRPRLLVADDEPDTREVMIGLLAPEFEVLAAADGQEALELTRAGHPDLILLDLKMPRLDGFQVLEQLRADPATRDIPVFLLSARCDDDAKVRGLALGAVDYLEKPISARELRARMERTLRLGTTQAALRDLADTDALTGLGNVRAFRARLAEEAKRARRYRTPLTAIMADVDRLKAVNDGLGHAAGDQVIAAVGRVLREELRETDFGARYGGDEFVLLLPNTEVDDGARYAERVSHRLRETALVAGGSRLRPGASFGVACLGWDEGAGAEALVQAADGALYAAKRAGGGCVRVAGRSPLAGP